MKPPGITEMPNELTMDIDIAQPAEIVRMLAASERQIYRGWREFGGLRDEAIVAKIARAAEWVAPLLGREDAVIVIAGAGTSGRLAMLVARRFNDLLRRRRLCPNVSYLIAGGDRALIQAQEGAEDDPHQGRRDLRRLIAGKRRVLYFGVTCGLSAPYVAGQLWRLVQRRGAQCVLIGFNPEDRARDTAVERWDKTFAEVLPHAARKDNCLILNPIVGPEPITGSTRMKGGSATKLILDAILAHALRSRSATRRAFTARAGSPGGASAQATAVECIQHYLAACERTQALVYGQRRAISRLAAMGGCALRSGGHIYYLGAVPAGILGIIDASECPPTFGAGFGDVRGFLTGGWRALLGTGHDLRYLGPHYRISLDDFAKDVLPTLTQNDLVVGIGSGGWDRSVRTALRRSRRAGARVACVQIGGAAPREPLDVLVSVPRVPTSPLPGVPLCEEYGTKIVLNALTTAAHILCGKVYRNRMIDLRISNNKLYHRAIGIVSHVANVSAARARQCLLRSIYRADRLSRQMLHAATSRHVSTATRLTKVVPIALVMARHGVTYAQAEAAIRREPVVRVAIERLRT